MFHENFPDEDAEHDTILDEISRVLTNIHRKYYELFQQSDQPLVKAPDKILDVKVGCFFTIKIAI